MPSLAAVSTPNAGCKYASLDVENEQANHPTSGTSLSPGGRSRHAARWWPSAFFAPAGPRRVNAAPYCHATRCMNPRASTTLDPRLMIRRFLPSRQTSPLFTSSSKERNHEP